MAAVDTLSGFLFADYNSTLQMQKWFSGVATALAQSIMTWVTMFCVVSTLERAARNVCSAYSRKCAGQNLVGLDTPPRTKGEELKERKAGYFPLPAQPTIDGSVGRLSLSEGVLSVSVCRRGSVGRAGPGLAGPHRALGAGRSVGALRPKIADSREIGSVGR